MKKFLRIMRGTQGALIVASALQIIFGFSGLWRNVARYWGEPLVIGIVFSLNQVAASEVLKQEMILQKKKSCFQSHYYVLDFFQVSESIVSCSTGDASRLWTLWAWFSLGKVLCFHSRLHICLKYCIAHLRLTAQVAKCVEIGLPELILLVIFAMVRIYFHHVVVTFFT